MIPSRKKLEAAFPGKGKEIRELLERKRDVYAYASVQELVRECYHPPKYMHRLETALNEILEGYGTEAIFGPDSYTQPDAVYINMGDAYNTTLLYDHTRGRWIVTSWGDWIESQERKGVYYG